MLGPTPGSRPCAGCWPEPSLLPFDAVADFDGAVRIYRRCRQAGVTPRGLVDCMIASVAWRHGAAILAQDVDLERVAAVMGVPLER